VNGSELGSRKLSVSEEFCHFLVHFSVNRFSNSLLLGHFASILELIALSQALVAWSLRASESLR
jgi:hypothetical protein